jgi:methylmalonyl-CoA/ethylmalonyl-CoA epimerase
MFKKLSHIGIAVKNLMRSSETFQKILDVQDIHIESVPDQKVNIAMLEIGGTHIELLEGSSEDSPIIKFIEKKGEGIHHLSFEVEDLEKELSRMRSEGFNLLDEKPRVGAGGSLIAFVHPKSTNGVLIELNQKAKNG